MEVGSYGNILFQITPEKLLTIKTMSREKKSKWGEQAVLNDLAFSEFRGRELHTISLDIQLVESLGGDITGTLSKLNDILENGENHYLTIGGNLFGDFPYVLEGVSENYDKYHDGFKYVELSLSLKEYRDNTKSLKQLKEERNSKNNVEQIPQNEVEQQQGSV